MVREPRSGRAVRGHDAAHERWSPEETDGRCRLPERHGQRVQAPDWHLGLGGEDEGDGRVPASGDVGGYPWADGGFLGQLFGVER